MGARASREGQLQARRPLQLHPPPPPTLPPATTFAPGQALGPQLTAALEEASRRVSQLEGLLLHDGAPPAEAPSQAAPAPPLQPGAAEAAPAPPGPAPAPAAGDGAQRRAGGPDVVVLREALGVCGELACVLGHVRDAAAQLELSRRAVGGAAVALALQAGRVQDLGREGQETRAAEAHVAEEELADEGRAAEAAAAEAAAAGPPRGLPSPSLSPRPSPRGRGLGAGLGDGGAVGAEQLREAVAAAAAATAEAAEDALRAAREEAEALRSFCHDLEEQVRAGGAARACTCGCARCHMPARCDILCVCKLWSLSPSLSLSHFPFPKTCHRPPGGPVAAAGGGGGAARA